MPYSAVEAPSSGSPRGVVFERLFVLLRGYIFGAAGRVLTQAAAGGATFVQGAAFGERAGNGQRLFGAQTVRVHINLHFVRVNPGAGMLLLSAGGKFGISEELSIGKKLRAFFTQLLHGGCDGNGQRHGTQNGLRFCTGCGGLNFARMPPEHRPGVDRSADRNIGECAGRGGLLRRGCSSLVFLSLCPKHAGRGGCSSAFAADGRGSKLFGISAGQQRLCAWFFSRSAWVVAK